MYHSVKMENLNIKIYKKNTQHPGEPFTAYTDNLHCQLVLKAYRYITPMGSGTGTLVGPSSRPQHQSTRGLVITPTLKRVTVQTSPLWDDSRQRAELVRMSPRTWYQMIWWSSRWTLTSCSGHESRTSEMWRRYSKKQLLADVFPSRRHRQPGVVESLLTATSPLSESPSFERSTSSPYGVERAVSLSAVSATRGRTKYSKKSSKRCELFGVLAAGRYARLRSSSAPTSLSPTPRPRCVEIVHRMTSYIYDVAIDLLIQLFKMRLSVNYYIITIQ